MRIRVVNLNADEQSVVAALLGPAGYGLLPQLQPGHLRNRQAELMFNVMTFVYLASSCLGGNVYEPMIAE